MKDILRKLLHTVGYVLYRYPDACERLMPHLKMLLPRYRIDTVIDVGANVGQFASAVRGLSPNVYIHSVEPNPDVYKTLEAQAASDKRWLTYECALGRSRGKVILNVTAASDFSSCLSVNEFGTKRFNEGVEITGAVEVDLKTLDEMVDGIPPEVAGTRLLLKLDTQGFDMEVLLGAVEALKNVQVIITEASLQPIYAGAKLFPEVLEFMATNGFTLSGFFPVSRSENLAIIESDCVFVRNANH